MITSHEKSEVWYAIELGFPLKRRGPRARYKGLEKNGGEVGVEELFVIVFGDVCSGLAGEGEIAIHFGWVVRDHGGAGERFVGISKVPVADLVLEAKVEAALRVIASGFGAF